MQGACRDPYALAKRSCSVEQGADRSLEGVLRDPTERGSETLLRVRYGFDQRKQLVETGRLTGLNSTDRSDEDLTRTRRLERCCGQLRSEVPCYGHAVEMRGEPFVQSTEM